MDLILQNLFGFKKTIRLSQLDSLIASHRSDAAIIEILLSIENVPPTITDYRERERYLEDLINTIETDKSKFTQDTFSIIVGLLTGSLYVNFEKFWGPTIHKVVDIVNACKFQRSLVEQLIAHLRVTNDLIYLDAEPEDSEDRPDHVLHRNFIFQILAKFPHHVEKESKIFMDEFFRFVTKELMVSPFIEKTTRSCLIYSSHEKEDSHAACPAEIQESKQLKTPKRKVTRKRGRKQVIPKELLQKRKSRETFVTVSKVIQSFKNQDLIHRNQELKTFVLDLLCCRDASVQRAAFNCLLVFEDHLLRPYVDKLLKILGDKTALSAITMLSGEETHSEQIKDEDRGFLMPILLRIVFGKMIGRIGKKNSGRDKADLRKNIVMRFIACCNTEEIELYFQFLFEPLHVYLDTSYETLAETIGKQLNYSEFVPLNKLQAMISSLTAYMETVANIKPDTLNHVLKLINIVMFHIIEPLEDQSVMKLMNERNIETLKSLRRASINAVTQFFHSFEYYEYQQPEIDFIFKNLIWRSTKGFIDRNHSVITPLLRFIQTLAGSKIYHKLLVMPNYDSVIKEHLLSHLIELYANEKTTRPVLKELAKILADLIDTERDNQEDDELMIEDSNNHHKTILEHWSPVVPEPDVSLYNVPADINIGQKMLINYTPDILNRLNQICDHFISKKDNESRIEKDELLVITSLSSYLISPEQSLISVRLLLTSLTHQKSGDLIVGTLRAAQTLLTHVTVNTDSTIVPLIADMMSYQRNPAQRKELCNLLNLLTKVDPNIAEVTEAIILMNYTSEEMVDAPDIAKWNEGFLKIFDYLDRIIKNPHGFSGENQKIRDPIILVLHQVCFIINSVDRYEFSIRDNSLTFHEKLAQTIAAINLTDSNLVHHLIDELVLEKFVKKGLRETNDMIRHSYIGILRSWALHCHHLSRTLHDFYLFCNPKEDLDFWINIRHIQLHNRSRALARLVANENIHQIKTKTLSGYFLPIASGFLFNKTYKSVSSLTENSIKLIGIICKHLNWVTYESTLTFYLDQLIKAKTTYQRTCIKLITEILKNFNFDLTACEEATKNEIENSKLEQRMRNRIVIKGAEATLSEVVSNDAPCGKKLNASTARMVYNIVTKKLIPKLSSCLHEMTRVEFEHDKNMSDYLPEKDEVKRIPMAFAIVQLLNLLPGRYLLFRDHLPVIFLKMSTFLKSKSDQIRKTARSILIKIMNFVGPAYISDLIRVLKQNLDKGFYIHVLNYTIHSVLDKVHLFYGSLDNIVQDLSNLCFKEIFGTQSEDKDIAQVLAKTHEAKKTKSYDTLMILATYISADKLSFLIESIKRELQAANNPKKVSKLSNCIQKVFTGLSKNLDFPLKPLLTFIQASIEESVPLLKIRSKVDQAQNPDAPQKPLRVDRYLIAKEFSRDRLKSKINEKGNYHMIVENSLRLLLHTLEGNKSSITKDSTLEEQLNKFVKLLTVCLNSSSPKCVMRALKCIYFIAQSRAELPYFKTKSNLIIKKIFILLSMYNGVGMVKGENSEMIAMCFKALNLLLLKCKDIILEDNQLRALVTYIEQDLHDNDRQITAFGTLICLLEKKFQCNELSDILTKVGELLVTSEDETVRKMCIKIWQVYLLEYKHEGKMLHVYLTRFLRQLDYEYIDGRKSIVQMLEVVLTKFPINIMKDYFELMFHLLSERLVNEESKEVRGNVGRLIGIIMRRLTDKQVYLFNQFILPWATNDKTQIKLLGVKLISVVIESSDKVVFHDEKRLEKVIEVVANCVQNEMNEENEDPKADDPHRENETEQESVVRLPNVTDKLNYHSLRLFRRLLIKNIIKPTDLRYIGSLKLIWQSIATKRLVDWYIPTVLTSCQLYLIFMKATNLSNALKIKDAPGDDYLRRNAHGIARTLIDNYIVLLDRPTNSKLQQEDEKKLLSYLTESMIVLGRMIAHSYTTLDFEETYLESFKKSSLVDQTLSRPDLPTNGFLEELLPHPMGVSKKRVELCWVAVKVVMQARKEAALFRLKNHYRRDFCLRWMAAIAQELSSSRIYPYAALFMMPPVRELTDKLKGASMESSPSRHILTMSEDLLKYLKGIMGEDHFGKLYSKVQLHYTKRRVNRKKKEAIVKVRDQARGVKRKMEQSRIKESKRKYIRTKERKDFKGIS